jgi:hypothetical protein
MRASIARGAGLVMSHTHPGAPDQGRTRGGSSIGASPHRAVPCWSHRLSIPSSKAWALYRCPMNRALLSTCPLSALSSARAIIPAHGYLEGATPALYSPAPKRQFLILIPYATTTTPRPPVDARTLSSLFSSSLFFFLSTSSRTKVPSSSIPPHPLYWNPPRCRTHASIQAARLHARRFVQSLSMMALVTSVVLALPIAEAPHI